MNLYSKARFTVRIAVVSPKGPYYTEEQCGVIYECECDVCGEVYVEETVTSLRQTAEEHVKSIEKGDSQSALSQHQETTRHIVAKKPVMNVVEKESRKG